jgi:TonB-linked SusC/RagA family outer membrane protein
MTLALVQRGPRFLLAGEHGKQKPMDVERTPLLREHIALDLDGVSLDDALATISRKAGIRLVYSGASLDLGKRVSFRVDRISVAAALTELLLDAHVDILFASSGRQAAIVDRGRAAPSGTLSGRVSDAATGEPVVGAQVIVEGANIVRLTNDSGSYAIADVPAGEQRVTARRLGYRARTQTVTVHDAAVATLDFILDPSATSLDEIVTTATGEQALRQMGNVIGHLRVDSLLQTAPITTLGDALTARAPGVQVFGAGGLTGASPQINIRGQNSLSLSNQPLLIVDGVRVDNSSAGGLGSSTMTSPPSGRFNDIPVSDIESVEIVKGPSAATLYGTDAANGVIVVKTKHGEPGPARWRAHAEGGALTFDRDRFTPSYSAWGHTPSATGTLCTLLDVANGGCVIDSVTSFSPLRDPDTSPIGTGSRTALGVDVSGGAAGITYFMSGDYESEVGYLRMPHSDARLLQAQRGGVPLSDEEMHPNAMKKYAARGNMSFPLGSTASLAASVGLTRARAVIPWSYGLEYGETGPGWRDANDGWLLGFRIGGMFESRHREDINHFTGSVTSTWTPWAWLSGRLTGGIDLTGSYFDQLSRAGEGFPSLGTAGDRESSQMSGSLATVNGSVTASFPLAGELSSRTSVGAQYNRQRTVFSRAAAQILAPGSETVAGAETPLVGEATTESVIAGTYVEEQLGFRERLFLTGGMRMDGSSAFGKGLGVAVYPKASISWLVSDEGFWPRIPGVSSLRLRAALGQAGVQPGPVAALASEKLISAFVDGGPAAGAGLGAIGNRELKPETQREFEAGIDMELLNGKLRFEGTYYDKRSKDALVAVPLPASMGGGTQWRNVGAVRNRGYELLATARVVDNTMLAWDVSVNGSINDNTVLAIGPGIDALYASGDPSIVRGYPLLSYFDYPILSMHDADGNGILEASELEVGDSLAYIGRSYPRALLSASTSVALWSGRVRLSAMLDHRGGFKIQNLAASIQCYFGNCSGTSDPNSTLADQARYVAYVGGEAVNSTAGFIEDASYTSLRELSATWELPKAITSKAHLTAWSVTLSARNVALWSNYSGADPQVQSQLGQQSYGAAYDAGGIPAPTYWLIGIHLQF